MRFDGLATFARWGRVAVWCSAAAWILSGSAALAQSRLEELEAELKARLRAAGVGREDPPAVAPPITPANTDQAGYLGVIADDRNETRG
ncbi:MAG TPA: hypothetical protein VGE52_04555, partial [Pirellulales bacterium]